MNPIDHAIGGDVEFFKVAPEDILLNSTDEDGRSVLACAVSKNHLQCCEEICARCPSLIYHQNKNGNTALHHAVWTGKSKMVKFLISVGSGADTEGNKNLLTMVNKSKCTALHLAVENEDRGIVNMLIEANPDKELLRMVNFHGDTTLHLAVVYQKIDIMQVLIEADQDRTLAGMVNADLETPLHLAVKNHSLEQLKLLIGAYPGDTSLANKEGKTPLYMATERGLFNIVEQILETCPSSLYGGPDGTTALHAAISNGHSDIRSLLLHKQPNQSKVRDGNGWTALHYAASLGDVCTVQDIVQTCPDCSEMVDNKGQNYIHVAAKHEQLGILQRALETTEISVSILNGKDMSGDTPLHIASVTGNQGIILCLLYDHRVNKKTKNLHGQTALDTMKFDYDKEKAGIYGVRDRVNEKELKDQSDFDLVVSALIATVSFTAGITVPGGFISEGPNRGMAVLSKTRSFEAFVISNTCALLLSLAAVFSHFCTRRLLRKKDIIFQVTLATFCTLGAIFSMVVAFITGSFAVLSISKRVSFSVCLLCCSFFIFAFHAMWTMAMQYKQPARVGISLSSCILSIKCFSPRIFTHHFKPNCKIAEFV